MPWEKIGKTTEKKVYTRGKTRNMERDFKILNTILERGRMTAYQIHKETGYPLSSVQYILKGFKERKIIDVVEHQERKPGQLERKFYDMTLYGAVYFLPFFIREDIDRISFLDKLGLPKFLEIIERGAKTDKTEEDDLHLRMIRTALELDKQITESKEFKEQCREHGINPYDFTIRTVEYLWELSKRLGYDSYFKLALMEPELFFSLIRKEKFTALKIVAWQSGLFDHLADKLDEVADHASNVAKKIRESKEKERQYYREVNNLKKKIKELKKEIKRAERNEIST